jgi:hypothetical protein
MNNIHLVADTDCMLSTALASPDMHPLAGTDSFLSTAKILLAIFKLESRVITSEGFNSVAEGESGGKIDGL